MTERNTRFLGFAKLMVEELDADGFTRLGGNDVQELTLLIAQRAYDFAWHVIGCVGGGFETNQYLNDEDILRDLEDMAQWPRRENADETQQSTT